ncbi:MAG: hypothetical protein ABL971_03350 [Vicinamibacterales bacterium]
MRAHIRRSLLAAVLTAGLPSLALAGAPVPKLTAASGLVRVAFEIPNGLATAIFPDDIAVGETFSGTFEAPAGFVLAQGSQRAKAGQTFMWRVPVTGPEGMLLVLKDRAGAEVGQIALRPPDASPTETAFRMPAMIQMGRPFPVHGPFDGRASTTRVAVGRKPATVIAESVRRVILRAPADVVGLTSAAVRESGRTFTRDVRSLGLAVTPAEPEAGRVEREITIRGLSGVTRDIPIEMGQSAMYVRHEEVSPEGVFLAKRTFRTVEGQQPVSLVIPSTRKDEVAIVLRTPSRTTGMKLAQQHAEVLKGMDFDAMPAMRELLDDFQLGGDAAYAALAVDEARALPMVLGAIPRVSTGVELIALDWFIGRPPAVRAAVATEARAAAHRVLARIVSTTTAELALYVLGLTGTEEDVPLLEKFTSSGGVGTLGLRDASVAALGRLGSRRHLDLVHGDLAPVLSRTSSFAEGARVARALRKASFIGNPELLSDVCAHVDDPKLWDIDIDVDPGAVSLTALAAIVDGTPVPPPSARRSRDEWRRYCAARPR